MPDRTIVITGASDGIGKAAARRLKADGERVVIVGRNRDKVEPLARELDCDFYLADNARLDDIRTLAEQLGNDLPRIDVLANNAGGVFRKRQETHDGIEWTFQVNHLAGFLLTNLLIEKLVESRASVIQTSSAAALGGRPRLHDLEHEKGPYISFQVYGDSKLMNVLFTAELQRRYGREGDGPDETDAGFAAAAFHPGIVNTSFGRGSGPLVQFLYNTPVAKLMATPEEGADTLIWLAERVPGRDWEPGQFYTKRRIGTTNPKGFDETLGREFWNRSLQYVGLPVTA